MIANRYRGEITAKLDGREWMLCLTLGALAELEKNLGEKNLSSLVARFSSGKLSANDMQAIIASGLRGGGHDVCNKEVSEMRCDGALTGYANIVAELLAATFFEGCDESVSIEKRSTQNPLKPQK